MLEKNYRRAYRMQLHEDDYGTDVLYRDDEPAICPMIYSYFQ